MAYHNQRKHPLRESVETKKRLKKLRRLFDSWESMKKQYDDDEEACESSDSNSLFDAIGQDMIINCLVRCRRYDYQSLALVNRNFRALIKSDEINSARRQQGVIEHWLYFYRHRLEFKAFDPVSQKWIYMPLMPSNKYLFFNKCFSVGTELLVFGKFNRMMCMCKYNILTNSWSYGTSMNVSRYKFGYASYGSIAIVAGGCDSSGKILNSVEMYNSEGKIWQDLPCMNIPRKRCMAVFMDGKFYVIGGIRKVDKRILTSGEEFDFETYKWTQIPNMLPVDRTGYLYGPPLVAVVNNELYLVDRADMELKKYNKETKLWTTLGELRAPVERVYGLIACGHRLIVMSGVWGSVEGFVMICSWVPSEGPLNWDLLDVESYDKIHGCSVMAMGC